MQVYYIFCIAQKINFVFMYNGPYLRVLTPRTTNGNNPLLNEHGQLQYKESHLPISAQFHLDKLNRSTPQHLRKKIEVVHGYNEEHRQVDEQTQTIEQLKAELAALKAQTAQSAEPVAPKASVITKEPAPQQLPKMTQEQPVQQQPAMPAKPKPATPNSTPQN